MTDLDPEEDAVLESARRAFTPSDGVTRRMRAALLAKVAAPGIVIGASAAASSAAASGAAASGAAASGAAASGAAASGAAVSGAATSSAVASAALTAASAAAATAGTGAPLAAAAGAVGAKVAVGAAFLKGAAGIATAVLLATATSPYWLPEASAPELVPAPAAAAGTHAQSALSAPATRAPRSQPAAIPDGESPRSAVAPKRIAMSPSASVAAQRMAANPTPEQKLQGELDLLRRAQQAIQAGQSQLALELLAKLDAEHRASSLGQEREVARVLALCGVGRVAAAREVAQRVLAVSPNSLYAGRIQSSCAAVAPTAPVQPSVIGSGKSTSSVPPVARFGDSGN